MKSYTMREVVLLVLMPCCTPSSRDQTYDACICQWFDMRLLTESSNAL